MKEKLLSINPLVRICRLLPATPQEVFAAWTEAESLREWMCPGSTTVATAELDVRIGGCFRIVMRGEEGDFVHTGEYREINPPERLVFTWNSTLIRGEVSLSRHGATLVTVEFHPQGEETELVLTHEWLSDDYYAAGYSQGWQSIAVKLEAYLQSRTKPAETY